MVTEFLQHIWLNQNDYGAMLEQTAGNGDGPPSLRRGFGSSLRIMGVSSISELSSDSAGGAAATRAIEDPFADFHVFLHKGAVREGTHFVQP